jgi:hypothetical protein
VVSLSRGDVVLRDVACQGWWLVDEQDGGPGRILAGPFEDRADASWAATTHEVDAQPVYGIGRADGGLDRRPSPQDEAWVAHLQEQLDRLPVGWDEGLSDDDPLVTLVAEVAAALVGAGLPLRDDSGTGEAGGVCLSPQAQLGAIVVAWRPHDRTSVEQVQGAAMDAALQQVMNAALAQVLLIGGFEVEAFAGGSGHAVRLAA